MRRYGPAVLLLLSGAAILRISLFSEVYLRYVQPGLRPFLIASGVVLVLLGAVSGWRSARDRANHSHEGHSHAHGPRVALLLAVPALALLLSPPPALGSYSAEREAARYAAQGVGTFPELPAGDPVDLTLGEYTSRAIYDSERSLKGRTVRMTGFVTREENEDDEGDDGTWYLTRLLVSCCAADAAPYRIEIREADAPPADAWVTVTGTWHPKGDLGTDGAWPPVLDATSVKRVAEPRNPYEKR
ncbi:TIGR03943 family putative permease subunit [Streptomyces poonensis]|uniref:TIGR03943 family protein n=1 Tax=Streptomyces poonensis TaxID=68255 RepID=A0A918UIK2_9ACTN|nr:TIGR03943 family protein [Streptomyces poonensis]GGZ12837.1 TIGR03943 family protein [Streptomyces poonensis]GLJ91977.1 TIGR03943 family protein [Streptomyces poonensis]